MELLAITLLLGLAAGGAWIFNRLVGLRNRAKSAWADIDVQLKRRHDLIGNLEEMVRGYAAHERGTLERVTRARNRAEAARRQGSPGGVATSENLLTGRLRALFALAESYPDLEAADPFLDLQRSLVEVEDALQNARRYYNAVVRDLNTRIESFPDLLVARPLGFGTRDYFELDHPDEARVPQLDLAEER